MDTERNGPCMVHSEIRTKLNFTFSMYDVGILCGFLIALHACPCIIEKLSAIQYEAMTCRAVLRDSRKEQKHVRTTRVLQLNFTFVRRRYPLRISNSTSRLPVCNRKVERDPVLKP